MVHSSTSTKRRFLSTLSLRRATVWAHQRHFAPDISIHALLAESDVWCTQARPPNGDFYPRSPCGERLAGVPAKADRVYFYPRSPCGERPGAPVDRMPSSSISIHALLAESDTIFAVRPYDAPIFLSTLSLRRATV